MTAPKEPDTNREQIEDILTLEEVAKYLRVHPTTIYRLMKKSAPHRLPAFRIGNGWRFARESVLAWRKEEEAAR